MYTFGNFVNALLLLLKFHSIHLDLYLVVLEISSQYCIYTNEEYFIITRLKLCEDVEGSIIKIETKETSREIIHKHFTNENTFGNSFWTKIPRSPSIRFLSGDRLD